MVKSDDGETNERREEKEEEQVAGRGRRKVEDEGEEGRQEWTRAGGI